MEQCNILLLQLLFKSNKITFLLQSSKSVWY